MSQPSTGLSRGEEKQVDAHRAPLAVDFPEAGRMLGLCLSTIYKLVRRGELTAFHTGRAHRVTTKSIEAYVARQLAANGTQVRRPRTQPELQDG
jgi:excisionase family DNA binding protein